MNRYIFIRRLMGPAILLLLGLTALLHEAHLVSWNLFVPLLLILIGVLKLAERAALASEGAPPPPPYPGAPYPNQPYQNPQYPGGGNPSAAGGSPYAQPTGSAIVPAPVRDFGKDSSGGQS